MKPQPPWPADRPGRVLGTAWVCSAGGLASFARLGRTWLTKHPERPVSRDEAEKSSSITPLRSAKWSRTFFGPLDTGRAGCYRASPKEVTSRSMVDSLRRKDFAYGVVVTPFDEAL